MDDDGARLLAGATVQDVRATLGLVVLRVRAPGETFHVALASLRAGPWVAVTRERPFKGGLPAFRDGGRVSEPTATLPLGEKLRLRARVEGARVVAIEERAVLLTREGALFRLEVTLDGGAKIRLRDAEGDDAAPKKALVASEVDAACARGDLFAQTLGEGVLAGRRHDVARALARACTKVERRLSAIEADLARIGQADALASRATAFVAEASRAPRGARSLSVVDWATGERVELALDPARSARDQIQAMFTRSRRLKLGSAIAEKRRAEGERIWEGLMALVAEVPKAESLEALEALVSAARALGPRDFALATGTQAGEGRASRDGKKGEGSRSYRSFRGASGARIWVGRGAAHNDALTFHTARPHDLWLHAKSRTGAHVIVPLEKAQTCPADVLVEAAHLAAHFSEAREESIVEIQYTPRRYLRKPRGAAPGFVVVEREKVLVLRVEPGEVARLLAAEELAP